MAQHARAGTRGPARIVLFTLAVALALSGLASAQAVRGTLLGNVNDTQGAAVPGVTVTATETQTNMVRTAVTNQSGHYVFANLKNGLYRVETELTGFKKFSRDGVEVKVNSTMRVDVILEVGAMTETVEVVQETPAPPDRPRRHRPDDRGPADPGAAPRRGPQLPGHVGHRARDRHA